MSNTSNTIPAARFSICLYGTKACGFTFLLANEAGLVATSGAGSDYGVRDGRGATVGSMVDAVAAALAFVPAGAPVLVHAPGSGRILRNLSRV